MTVTSPPRRTLISAFAGAVVLMTACGGPEIEAQPRSATLEVANRSAAAQIISIRGRDEGTVPAGERIRFRHLAPGPAHLSARPKFAAPGEREEAFAEQLELVRGVAATWVLPGPRPLPPGLADVEVLNALARPLVVHLDDRRLGRVLAGDTRTFRGVPAGSRTLRAVQPDSGLELERTVELAPDDTVAWTLETDTGTIRVVNDTPEPFQLYLDGRAEVRLPAGDTAALEGVEAGPHELEAHGLHTGLERHQRVRLDPDVPHEWRLRTHSAALEVVNGTGENLALELPTSAETGAAVTLALAPGERHLVEDLPAGERLLKVRGEASGLPYDDRVLLAAGQRLEWVIRPARRSIRLENHTNRPLDVSIEGYRRGRMEPGAMLLVGRLEPGPVEVVASTPEGGHAYRRVLDPGPDRAAVWRIDAAVGAAQVVNRSPDPVIVFVDARRLGRLEADTSVVLTGVEVGRRLFEAVDERGAQVARRPLVVHEDEVRRWVIEDPRATLLLTNRSGEPLRVEGRLASQQGRVAPDQRILYYLPGGAARVRAVGLDSGLTYTEELNLRRGGVAEWEVRPPRASLQVVNRLPEVVSIEIDGHAEGRVAAGGERVFEHLPAGSHDLRAEGARSEQVRKARRALPPEGVAQWVLEPKPARLLIYNDIPETVSVYLDDRPYGRVEASSRRGFEDLPTGRRELRAVALGSGWTHTVSLTLEDGATTSARLPPPSAVLLVGNPSGEPQELEVDGEVVGEVAAGAVDAPLAVPTGERRIRFTGLDSGRTWFASLTLRPSQTVSLTIPPPSARLVVVNQTDGPLLIRVDEERLGELGPGESRIVEDVEPGRHHLEARDPDGRITHEERRVLRRGRTATWVLPGLPPEGGSAAP